MSVTEAALQVVIGADTKDAELGIGNVIARLGEISLAAAGIDGIADGFKHVVGAAADWQTTLTNIHNNTTATNADMQTLNDGVMQLANQTGAPLDQLAQGFTHVMNITGDTKSAMDILSVANESATSTGGNVADTANVLANAMHEYGLDVSHAATAQQRHNEVLANANHVMGVMHLAAAEGNMTLEQFSQNSGNAIGTAANLGIPLEQVSAAFVALTKHGFDAAGAGTQITDIMTHMMNPTKSAETELQRLSKLTGVDLVSDFSAAGLHSKGFTGILADLHAAFTKMGMSESDAEAETMKLVNAQRGGLGLARLLGTGAQDYATILADVSNKQKVDAVTAEAMARTHATLGNQFAVLRNNVETAAISLGTALLPTLTGGVGALTSFTQNLVPLIQHAGPELSGAFHSAQAALLPFQPALRNLEAAFRSLIPEPVQTFVRELLSSVQTFRDSGQAASTLQAVLGGVVTVVNAASVVIGALVTVLADVVKGIHDNVGVQALLVGILGAASAAWALNTAAAIAHRIATTAVTTATRLMAAAQLALNAVMEANPIGLVIVAIAGLAAIIIYAYQHSETFRDVVNGAFSKVQDAATALWNVAKQVFGDIGGFFEATGTKVDQMRDAIQAALSAVGGFFSALGATVSGVIDGILAKVQQAMDAINGLKAAASAIGNIVAGAAGVVSSHLPGRADGGPVSVGSAYVVGERGPELFIPGASGTIIPSFAPPALAGAGAAGRMQVNNFYLNGTYLGNDSQMLRSLAQALKPEMDRLVTVRA